MKLLSCVWLFATPWSIAYQAPLSMGFSRQEYWSGLPFPSPGDLPKSFSISTLLTGGFLQKLMPVTGDLLPKRVLKHSRP